MQADQMTRPFLVTLHDQLGWAQQAKWAEELALSLLGPAGCAKHAEKSS
jgi:hypothetical protein